MLVESIEDAKGNMISKFFGYRTDKIEPRLFELKYNRELHEKLQALKQRLKQGQPVAGKFKKEARKGKVNGEKGKKSDKNGEGSESQDQRWEFHELLPSEIQGKPER